MWTEIASCAPGSLKGSDCFKKGGPDLPLESKDVFAIGVRSACADQPQGLNIFNTSLTLAKPDTATDADYERIEGSRLEMMIMWSAFF